MSLVGVTPDRKPLLMHPPWPNQGCHRVQQQGLFRWRANFPGVEMTPSQTILLPMASNLGREYAVTVKERRDLARRLKLSMTCVEARLEQLRTQIRLGLVPSQTTANKTRKIIEDFLRNP